MLCILFSVESVQPGPVQPGAYISKTLVGMQKYILFDLYLVFNTKTLLCLLYIRNHESIEGSFCFG